jgi:SAM-dependent methyltransferase
VSHSDARSEGQNCVAGDARVRAWLEIRDPLERQLEPFGRATAYQLHLRSGERVLDIGFGIGSTPFALAAAVGPNGEVVGIDVLQAALDVMHADERCSAQVSLVCGDAEVFPFVPASFDAVFSRFGVMFFSDPVAAFSNICRALRPGGRLAFVCWRRLADNELDALPIRVASPFLPAQIVADAEAAGHFSFADPAFLRETLTRAGFVDINVVAHDEDVRSGSLQAMIEVCSRVGSLGAILREHPELAHAALPALKKALAASDGPEGPALQAGTWIVLAQTPT